MEGATALMPFVPAVISQTASPKEKKCMDRICPYLRAAPAVIAMACLVMAVICAVIWNKFSLAMVFGTGTAGSIYAVYLSCDYSNQKSFAENNERLEQAILKLQGVYGELCKESEKFQTENKQLLNTRKSLELKIESLSVQLQDFKFENGELKKTRDEIDQEIGDLNLLKNRIEFQTNLLGDISSALTVIQTETNKDHTVFGNKVSEFQTAVTKLIQTNDSYVSTGKKIDADMKTQIETLSKIATTLSGFFTQIEVWKKSNKEQIDNNEALRKIKEGLQTELNTLKVQIADSQGQAKVLSDNVSDLKTLKTGFDGALKTLLQYVGKLGNLTEDARSAMNFFTKHGMHN